MIGTLISGTTALVLPLFASYRALVSNDISLIRPWLMYWVVFASFQFTESMFRPFLQFVPFYGLFRQGFLLWLVMPQTQGAVQLYQTRLEPWLSTRDQAIDQAIAKAIEFVRNSPIGGLLQIFGISLPKPPAAGGTGSVPGVAGPQPGAASSVTDMFMSRFRLPSTPDINIAAYLPSLLGSADPNAAAGSGEYSSIVRNRLLGMIKSLDANSPASSTPSREADDYDFVEKPKSGPSTPGETEIEREIEEKLLQGGQRAESASASQNPSEARRRWF